MHAHRFAIGQIVDFSPGLGEAAARRGNYEVVRLLPADAHNNQYRIKSVNDGHERVAKESQLAV